MPTMSIPDSLRLPMEDILNEREISIAAADNFLKKFAFAIVQRKNALGIYDETEYLSSIPGMKESIIEGMSTPLSECLDYE